MKVTKLEVGVRPLDVSIQMQSEILDVINQHVGKGVPLSMVIGVLEIVKVELLEAHE